MKRILCAFLVMMVLLGLVSVWTGTAQAVQAGAGNNRPAAGIFDVYPKGVYLLPNHRVADPASSLARADFVVGRLQAGNPASSGAPTVWTDIIQMGADAGKPVIGLLKNDPERFVEQYQSLNLDHWLKSPKDNYLYKELVEPALMSGGVMRQVHGIIVDMNKLYQSDGKRIPDGWIVDTARFWGVVIPKFFGIPVWYYIDPAMSAMMDQNPKGQWVTFLAEKDGAGQWKLPGISTWVNYQAGPAELYAGAGLPIPPDSYSASLSTARRDSGLGNAKMTNWLCYSTGRWTLPGITGGAVPLFMYFGSRAGLYETLKFTAPVVEIPTETPAPVASPTPTLSVTPSPGGGGADTLTALGEALDAFAEAWLRARGR